MGYFFELVPIGAYVWSVDTEFVDGLRQRSPVRAWGASTGDVVSAVLRICVGKVQQHVLLLVSSQVEDLLGLATPLLFCIGIEIEEGASVHDDVEGSIGSRDRSSNGNVSIPVFLSR